MPSDLWYEPDAGNKALHWLVRDENKNPVGFCILTIMKYGTAFLSFSGILEEARGNGLQCRMIRVRERKARKEGVKKLISYTKMHNIQSSHNLQKCGFELYAPEEPYADKDCLYWLKILDE